MKKKFRAAAAALAVFIAGTLFVSCGVETYSVSSDTGPYAELSAMPEISADGSVITAVIAEDEALPYRWAVYEKSGNVTVKDEYTVNEPDRGGTMTGSSPAFHVFVFEASDTEDVHIHMYNKWVYSENLGEANGEKEYTFVYEDGGFVLKE